MWRSTPEVGAPRCPGSRLYAQEERCAHTLVSLHIGIQNPFLRLELKCQAIFQPGAMCTPVCFRVDRAQGACSRTSTVGTLEAIL